MKVLHLLKTSIGASWALRQTRELVALGVEVHVALPDGPLVAEYQKAGVHTHIVDVIFEVKRPWHNIKKSKQLKKLVEEINPDIVHSHFVATTFLMRLALRKTQVPRVFQVPGPLHLEHWLYKRIEIILGNKYDYWLASCQWTQDEYQRCGIEPSRTGLAYYGVNEEDFKVDDHEKIDLRNVCQLEADDYLVGMVAYFYAPKAYLGQKRGLKGHEDFIDAIAIVRKKYPAVKSVIIGGPWGGAQSYFDGVKQYAQERLGDACVFLGIRKDVPLLYPQLNLAVHPSHSENVGAAAESMYSKVSTLSSDVGGFPDLVIDGETGYMAPAKNPEALAAKIIEAYLDEAEQQRRVENAYQKVKTLLNVKQNVLDVNRFYEHVLKQQRAG
ncbi:glycosyltransferase [Paraglaciecola arctica]|uniref:glycosyltransferase n=1 Tax=Paraglaciecola arctica TaxID=1128911 RepID=UPI001C06E5F2|nr:glycosyltransferase [Paraglaciecola arctica]MBU3002440.1 glycosyltransferase [Paraglaciecola arctica]